MACAMAEFLRQRNDFSGIHRVAIRDSPRLTAGITLVRLTCRNAGAAWVVLCLPVRLGGRCVWTPVPGREET
jgi:hypothetical protein